MVKHVGPAPDDRQRRSLHPVARGEAVTEDAVLGGRVRLRQSRAGYRAGLDAALLAAAVELAPGERAVEAGCGVGGALLQAAARSPGARLLGLERDANALALALANIALNGMEGRAQARAGTVALRLPTLGEAPFDAAFTNPPFFDDPAALRAPAPEKRGAWMADDRLPAWCAFLTKVVREGGRITMIHRADRLADVLAGLREGAGSFRIRPVQPFADVPAKRVLVRAVKTGRAPLVLLPPLALHRREGGWTAEADAVLRGEAGLEW